MRWNPFLSRWILLYNRHNPNRIVLRTAAKPWGTWGEPRVIFDPESHDGYRRFMHQADENGQPLDHLSDPGREGISGDAYGPYQIAPYATGSAGEWSRLFFTMSTWNPYQVVLMSVVVDAEGRTLDSRAHP